MASLLFQEMTLRVLLILILPIKIDEIKISFHLKSGRINNFALRRKEKCISINTYKGECTEGGI